MRRWRERGKEEEEGGKSYRMVLCRSLWVWVVVVVVVVVMLLKHGGLVRYCIVFFCSRFANGC